MSFNSISLIVCVYKFCLTYPQIVPRITFMPAEGNSTTSNATENLVNDSHADSLFVNRVKIARRYGVCQRTIQNMAARRILPFYKWGRCVRFKISECDAALERFKRDAVSMKGVNQ